MRRKALKRSIFNVCCASLALALSASPSLAATAHCSGFQSDANGVLAGRSVRVFRQYQYDSSGDVRSGASLRDRGWDCSVSEAMIQCEKEARITRVPVSPGAYMNEIQVDLQTGAWLETEYFSQAQRTMMDIDIVARERKGTCKFY